MSAVGIDISKGKSILAVVRPFGEVVVKPYEVRHTASELRELAEFLKSLGGEPRVILEHRYGLDNGTELRQHTPMDTMRNQLKRMNRQ